MQKKGYSQNMCTVWGLLGIVLGIIALCIVLCKKPCNSLDNAKEIVDSTPAVCSYKHFYKNISDIKIYKDLFDEKIITADEFYTMKKIILHL